MRLHCGEELLATQRVAVRVLVRLERVQGGEGLGTRCQASGARCLRRRRGVGLWGSGRGRERGAWERARDTLRQWQRAALCMGQAGSTGGEHGQGARAGSAGGEHGRGARAVSAGGVR